MSKTFSKLILGASLLCAPAYATKYQDFDIINHTIDPSVSDRLYGTFDLLTAGSEGESASFGGYFGDAGGNGFFGDIGGFTTGTPIDNATLSFWFSDPDGGIRDGFSVKIDVGTLSNFATVDIDPNNNTELEFSNVLIEAFSFGAEVILSISNTGQLVWKVQATGSGKFRIDAGKLTVNVPDGGSTAILLGLGMLGMVGVQRKLRK